MAIQLAGTKPHVAASGSEVAAKFGLTTVYGLGARANASDHPKGLALDLMVPAYSPKGDAIAEYLLANWDRMGLKYIIWKQRISYGPGKPWKPMASRGSITANHFDHVHASYNAQPGTGGPAVNAVTVGVGTGSDTTTGMMFPNMNELLAVFSTRQFWLRFGMVIGGAILIVYGLLRVTGSDAVIGSAVKTGAKLAITKGKGMGK